jgi:hypothetical protein
MKKTRGLYHVFERRYLNFSSRTFLKILVIHTAPTVGCSLYKHLTNRMQPSEKASSDQKKQPLGQASK